MRKRRNTLISPEKYDLGDFVTKNQQNINAGFSGAATLGSMTGNDTLSGVTSGMASGAALGSAVMPGIGTAVGAVGGAIFGGILGGKKAAAKQEERNRQEGLRRNLVYDQFESDINTVNENPYGVYEDGGTVTDPPKKVTLSKAEATKRRNAIYAPIRDKISRVAMSNTDKINPNIIDVMSVYDLYPGTTEKNSFGTALNNPPEMNDNIKDLQNTINKMSDKNLRGLLETNWNGLSTREAISKARAAGLGFGDIIKYGKFFKGLGASGNTFADGGDVSDVNIINIEKGELQINPENGKIIREFTGINPETGGLYEPHSKGEDTVNNLVNAEEGTFIISKDKSSAYKNAIKNNDKLHQNSILQNIRNRKKELTSKYAKGGDINRQNLDVVDNRFGLPMFVPNQDSQNMFNDIRYGYGDFGNNIYGPKGMSIKQPINTPASLNGKLVSSNTNAYLDPVQNSNNNSWNDLFGYGIGLYNMARGLQSPETQSYRLTSPSVRNRQQVLNNMPNTVSVNPALNSIAGNAYNTNQDILANTSNPAIARALLLANSANANNAFNDAYYQNNNINNSIMGTRANIYSNLAQSDEALRSANNRSMLETDETNRALRMAKEQQFNTGLSQLQENWRNNQSIRSQQRNDRLRLRLLQDTNPYLKYYSGNWMDNLDQNIR